MRLQWYYLQKSLRVRVYAKRLQKAGPYFEHCQDRSLLSVCHVIRVGEGRCGTTTGRWIQVKSQLTETVGEIGVWCKAEASPQEALVF